jgi:hypothetical protein
MGEMDKKNAQLARSRAFFFQKTTALAEHLDYEGTRRKESNTDGDRRNRGYLDLLFPPVGGGPG